MVRAQDPSVAVLSSVTGHVAAQTARVIDLAKGVLLGVVLILAVLEEVSRKAEVPFH